MGDPVRYFLLYKYPVPDRTGTWYLRSGTQLGR